MHILAPHISCICNTAELQDVVNQGYKEIYIMTVNGTFKHHILRTLNGKDRYVRIKVDKIPGYTEPKIEEGMNFLPAGKIPYEIYEQILGFFKKVMEVKTAELEAMIHILYNPERGYHLGVPPQTISKAAVSYDWDYLPAGTSIIVDIHSHNTMGAFFSGTDDRDDRGNISFSGVFGKLKDREPMTCWRFNYFDKKFAASVEDLFDAPARPEVEIPEEWIENVKVQTYVAPKYQGGHSGQGNVVGAGGWGRGLPGQVSGNSHDQLSKWRYDPKNTPNPPKAGTPGSPGNPINQNVQTTGKSFEDMEGDDSLLHFFGSELPENYPAAFNSRGNVIPTVSGPAGDDDSEFVYVDDKGIPENVREPNFGVNSLPEDYSHLEGYQGEGSADPVGKSSGARALSEEANTSTDIEVYEEENDGNVDPHYAAIAAIHGTDVADSWWSIAHEMSTLDGLDELNAELICDMAGLMTDEGQLKVFSELFDRLSPTNKAKIETHGF